MRTAEDEWVDRYAYQTRGWATNDLRTGLRSFPLDEALAKTYIATNTKTFANMIVLDVDDDDTDRLIKTLAWDDEVLPEPNWMTINPNTGHGHVGYWLQDPVRTDDLGRIKPMQFAAAITEGLRQIVPADPAYTGRITRSPFMHPTTYMRDEMWDLRDLAGKITIPKRLPKQASEQGLGRNCTLFNDLRHWAYRAVLKFEDFGEFQMAVQMMAETLSVQFITDPLPSSEIRSIANSVSRWTWGRFNAETFSTIQSRRARKHQQPISIEETNVDRNEYQEARATIRRQVVALHQEGKTYREIGKALNLTYGQVQGHIQYARRLQAKNDEKA